MNKYLVQIQFRYNSYESKTRTIGVYETFEEACEHGNNLLKQLESRFPIHVFPDSGREAEKERFSLNGGAFRSKNVLVTDLAYLKTPFSFFAKISTLNYEPVDSTIDTILEEIKRRKED